MRRLAFAIIVGVFVGLQVTYGQGQAPSARVPRPAPAATPLAVRRVVLYKNGVSYIEHIGRVRDNGSLALDLSSSQLDDVLNTLTALDLGNGTIAGVSYNSTDPLQHQLNSAQPPAGDGGTLIDLLQGLRGAQIQVTSGGTTLTGRVVGVERQRPAQGSTPPVSDQLTLVSNSGELRRIALSPAARVTVLDRDSAGQMASYVSALASTRTADRRRLTIATNGAGQRDVLVTYVVEAPIWKTSYRVLLARDGEQPTVQGWAIVDNVSAEDWTNVDLSLIAGAPQSFIQQISQPRYVRRPVVQPPQSAMVTPQTHDPALKVDSVDESVTITGEKPSGAGGRGGGVVGGLAAAPATAAFARQQNLNPGAGALNLTDLFEYHISTPISIRRNQSALIPIVNAHVDADRVSLWSERTGRQPLRALWLTNSTDLTLDAGSFTVLEDGVFGGEGLLDAVKPGERRLVSYGVDAAVQVESHQGDGRVALNRLVVSRGVLIEYREQRDRRVYTIRNNDENGRTVVIEHPVRAGWSLAGGVHAAETTASAYRFKVDVGARQTATLTIDEVRPEQETTQVSSLDNTHLDVLIRVVGANESVKTALVSIVDQKAALAAFEAAAAGLDRDVEAVAQDQARLRQNLSALRDSAEERALAKRYASQLATSEDQLGALKQKRQAAGVQVQEARTALTQAINLLAFDQAFNH